MSKEFIKKGVGAASIAKARRQQRQLSYFTQSEIQDDLTTQYYEQFAERNYSGDTYFLEWIKNIFKQSNFLFFFKYLRNPVVSAELINNEIVPELERVFHAEDSYFNYSIGGKLVEPPESLDVNRFNNEIFRAHLFRFNDIVITDLKDINKPFYHIVSINDVVALKSSNSVINKIAYAAEIKVDGIETHGYLYIDDKAYIFYNKELEVISEVMHDLGRCPADYIVKDAFANDDIVRKCIFSHVRSSLEDYVFLDTLLKMTIPNGALPVATVLAPRNKGENKDAKVIDGEPMSLSNTMGSQKSFAKSETISSTGSGSLQASTVIEVPMVLKADGSFDMDVVKNYLNFFHVPVDILEFLQKRVSELKISIKKSLLGEVERQNKNARNELDVESGFSNAEDRLRALSLSLSRIRERTDYNILSLEYGANKVVNSAFYGSDFFLGSTSDLYELFNLSPNPLERRNVLLKISKIKNKFNKNAASRDRILYGLMPYVSDLDFNAAVAQQAVTPESFALYSQFNYWIDNFEASYGDILGFWDALTLESDAAKLSVIKGLINQEIKMAILPKTTNT